MVVPNQPQHFNPETQVQVDHTCNVHPVAGMIILGKIATRINYCTMCMSKSHATHMYRAPVRNSICIYCGSTQHSMGNHTSHPNDNREEPRSAPWDLHSQGPYYRADTEYSGSTTMYI